jgi:hypothetical protein
MISATCTSRRSIRIKPTWTIIKPVRQRSVWTFTCLLTPRIRVLLKKITGSQPVKKFHALYGTWRFFTEFTLARHLSLSWARSIQSTPPKTTSWRSILLFILQSTAGSYKWCSVWAKSTKLNPNICTRFGDISCHKRDRKPEETSCPLSLLGICIWTYRARQNHKLRRTVSHETYIFSIHFLRRKDGKKKITGSIWKLIAPYTRFSVWTLRLIRDAQII